MDFLLFLVPLLFVISLITLFCARQLKYLFWSTGVFVTTCFAISWFFGALQNVGAAWGGGRRVDPTEYGFAGFLVSLVFCLIVVALKKWRKKLAQQDAAGQSATAE